MMATDNPVPQTENHDESLAADEAPIGQQPLDQNRIVRHIMIIGFHHKHGYQVDYCYPPLSPGGPTFTTPTNPITLPGCWKTLPLLCLPDGSHNYDSDTIYFTMPDIVDGGPEDGSNECDIDKQQKEPMTSGEQHQGIRTIFGTACYRQIHVEKLVNRTDDMTRIAVQKSVCVLSTQPLFGLIRSKLEMITHAYFEELDFSKVRIIKLTYDNLNSLLSRESVRENATFLGLSARHLVGQFGNNMLVLYKAMLLEKKILFYKSPVRDLCSTIMSMCSLFSGLLECGGLDHSTCDLQLSPTLLEALKLEVRSPPDNDFEEIKQREGKVFFSPAKEQVVIMQDDPEEDDARRDNTLQAESDLKGMLSNDYEVVSQVEDQIDSRPQQERKHVKTVEDEAARKDELDEDFELNLMDETIVDDQHVHKLCQMKPEDCGFPLQIFARGSFCLPYLSISYLDLLSDSRVRSFVIGATNFLFKQRREMYDVIVDMEENTISIQDGQLKQALSLSIEDLRFMDYIQKHVNPNSSNFTDTPSAESAFDPINHDTTKWLGGDEWIRYHFKIYTLYLLKAAKTASNLETFNTQFIRNWKIQTNNYRIWDATGKAAMLAELQARHPFSSSTRGINFSDMKLKLSYAVNSSDKGRMVNQTFTGISKWSIWNNIASAGTMAASTVSTLANSASTAINSSTSTSNSDKQSSTRYQRQ